MSLLLRKLESLPAADRSAELQRAVEAGEVKPAAAAEIARDLKLPNWEHFNHAKVGTNSHGTSDQKVGLDHKVLPPNSPLFAAIHKLDIEPRTPLSSLRDYRDVSGAEQQRLIDRLDALAQDSAALEKLLGPGWKLTAEKPYDHGTQTYFDIGPSRSEATLRIRQNADMSAGRFDIKPGNPKLGDPSVIHARIEVPLELKQNVTPTDLRAFLAGAGAKSDQAFSTKPTHDITTTGRRFVLEATDPAHVSAGVPVLFDFRTDILRARAEGGKADEVRHTAWFETEETRDGKATEALAKILQKVTDDLGLPAKPTRSKAAEAAAKLGLI